MSSSEVRKYEGMFLVDSALANGNWDATVEAVQTILSRADAEVISLKKWDDRRLCYPVAKAVRGTYILTYFNADPLKITGIERDVQISEDVLRVLILKGDIIPQDILDSPTPLECGASHAEDSAEDADEAKPVDDDDIEEVIKNAPSIDEIDD